MLFLAAWFLGHSCDLYGVKKMWRWLHILLVSQTEMNTYAGTTNSAESLFMPCDMEEVSSTWRKCHMDNLEVLS